MPNFSRSSNIKLGTCHPKLQRLFREVIKRYDCTVVWGYRGEEDQNKAFEEGNSKVRFPHSKHNQIPALAVDVAPYIEKKGDVSWENKQCYFFAGYVLRVAEELGIDIRLGADWDGDFDVNDQTLFDPCHFEVKEE